MEPGYGGGGPGYGGGGGGAADLARPLIPIGVLWIIGEPGNLCPCPTSPTRI